MKRYARGEMEAFLKAVDRHAPRGAKAVIIGGAAAALSFGVGVGTVDIDTANPVGELRKACRAAREDTGLEIPLERATEMDAPRGYADRLKKVPLRGLRNLKLLVPEKHDWALMKIVRCEDKDLEHLQAASKKVGLSLPILEDRFLREMTHVLPRERIMAHFLAAIEELYGSSEAGRVEETLRKHPSWK